MHISEEDYLKAIYEMTIEKNQELVKTHDLAIRFSFTDQTVNEMIKKLNNKGLVLFSPYKGVSLTDEGKSKAILLIRAHRMWEVFLTKSLGFDWTEVHQYAEDLEHTSNERLIDRLYEFLDEPKFSHDGSPIPSKEGFTSDLSQITLYDLNINDRFKIERVIDIKGLISYLDSNDIKLSDEFMVVNRSDFAETIDIKKDKVVTITKKIASLIYVKKI